jgi:organic radical activating enzyme
MMTHWCNFSCDFCGVPVFFKRSSTLGKQAHAFDYYSAEEWLRAFSLFPQEEISCIITGGEPFLDRGNFSSLLAGLLDDKRFHLRINTNATWDPSPYRGLDTSRVYLTVSYHPAQTSFSDFRGRVLRIKDAGFQFTDLHVVLAPENLDAAEQALTVLEEDGFPISGIPMIPAGIYRDRTVRESREWEMIQEYSYPLSAYFNLVQPETNGKPCYHPAFSYRLSFDGTINVACAGAKQNIFTDGLPELPLKAVACPAHHCEGCSEMIRAIPNVPHNSRPLSVFHPEEARQEIVEYRESRRTGVRPQHQATFAEIEKALTWESPVAGSTFVPVGAIEPVPLPPFGFIDKKDGSDVITALNRGRLDLYGWAGSSRVGEPMKQVNLFVDGTPVASINTFYPRPEVAEIFKRPDLLQTGWRAYFFLPNLPKGDHVLVAQAVTSGGTCGELPAFTIRIVD